MLVGMVQKWMVMEHKRITMERNRKGSYSYVHFITKAYHSISSPNEDGHGSGILAVFNHQHAIFGGAKAHLSYNPCGTQLLGSQITKPEAKVMILIDTIL